MKTARGIYLDLGESSYIYELNRYRFYFSSLIYMNKFIDGLGSYIEMEELKLKNRLKIDVDLSEILCINYYMKIEKRGFHIEYDGIFIDRGMLSARLEIDILNEG